MAGCGWVEGMLFSYGALTTGVGLQDMQYYNNNNDEPRGIVFGFFEGNQEFKANSSSFDGSPYP